MDSMDEIRNLRVSPSQLKHFRFWCQKVLPLVYDDSLSYYEVLCKVRDYINQLIEIVTDHEERIEGLEEAVASMQEAIAVIQAELERIGNFVPDPNGAEAGWVLTLVDDHHASWQPAPKELPDYDISNAGDILEVDSDGNLVWADAPEELPAHSAANSGYVLMVDSQGNLVWSDSVANLLTPTYITDNSWISFSSSNGGTIIRSSWCRINADKSIDFEIDLGWQHDNPSDPTTTQITCTPNWTALGGTYKNLEQSWILYAVDIGLGTDPGVIGMARQQSNGNIVFNINNEDDISFSGRMYLQ